MFIKRPRVGGRLSASAFDRLARVAEQSRASNGPEATREGGALFDVPAYPFVPEFARIDDATARPIGAGTPYNVVLIDDEGNAIDGSDFDAFEMSGNRSVPDESEILVVPVAGTWGFLWRPRRLTFAGACVIDSANPGVASANTWGITFGATAYGGGGGELAKSILVKFAGGPVVLENHWYKCAIIHNLYADFDGIATAGAATINTVYKIYGIDADFQYEGGSCETYTSFTAGGGKTDATFGGTVEGSASAQGYVSDNLDNDYLRAYNGQPVADELDTLGDATGFLYGIRITPCEPIIDGPTPVGTDPEWSMTIEVGTDGSAIGR